MEDKVKRAKLRHERETLDEEILNIRVKLTTGKFLTRDELIAYLRGKANQIHANVIIDKEMLREE